MSKVVKFHNLENITSQQFQQTIQAIASNHEIDLSNVPATHTAKYHSIKISNEIESTLTQEIKQEFIDEFAKLQALRIEIIDAP